MSTASNTATKKANRTSASSCARKRNYLRFGPKVMETARAIFPYKTAINLSFLTGDPVRTWEYWLSNERMPAEALGALLASEHGMQFLDVIAGQSKWWRSIRSALALADQQKHAMQEAANALRALTQTPETVCLPDVAGLANSALASVRNGVSAANGGRSPAHVTPNTRRVG